MKNDYEFLKIEKDDRGVMTLTLNRPELHNAFNDDFIAQMTEVFEALKGKDGEDVKVLLLKGEGKSFCAGADLNWMKRMKDYSDQENFLDSMRLSHLFQELNSLPMPVIASVNGATLGGGTGIIAACDFVIAASEAKFGFTEVGLGLVPAVISPFVMAKIGESFARAYFLSGERFDAFEAQRMNLVHKVVKDDDLEAATAKQVERFLRAGPVAQREAKALIHGVLDHRLNLDKEIHEYTCQTIARVRTSDEGQEGMSALLEKRKPKWSES